MFSTSRFFVMSWPTNDHVPFEVTRVPRLFSSMRSPLQCSRVQRELGRISDVLWHLEIILIVICICSGTTPATLPYIIRLSKYCNDWISGNRWRLTQISFQDLKPDTLYFNPKIFVFRLMRSREISMNKRILHHRSRDLYSDFPRLVNVTNNIIPICTCVVTDHACLSDLPG